MRHHMFCRVSSTIKQDPFLRFLAVRTSARPIGRWLIIVIAAAREKIESEIHSSVGDYELSLAAIFSKAGTLASDRRNVILPRTDGAIRGNAD